MGRKGNWCSAVKKALSAESREKKDKKTRKSKGWFWKPKIQGLDSSQAKTTAVVNPAPSSPIQEVKLIDTENEQAKHAYSVALASAVAAEAAVAAAQAAAEVVRLTAATRRPAKSKEEIAAIIIQAAFRGHMARRALRALKGVVRLKTLIQGQFVKRQATTTLHCMQTMARVQAQVRARRIRMSEENQALQKHLQQKHEKELEKFRSSIGEDWDDSTQSKEQIKAKLQSQQEAAARRERALAYAYSHQQTWRNSPKSVSHTFLDPHNPQWGWSWLERWMAARPWESQSTIDKELNSEPTSAKSTSSPAHTRRDLNLDNKPSSTAKKKSRTPGRLSVSSPRTKTPTSASAGRVRPPSPKRSVCSVDDDARSTQSVQSERCRRHSVTGASPRDDVGLASSPPVPSYMASTESVKAKSRTPSPLGLEKSGTPEKESVVTAKKRLSVSGSPSGPRRHSGPPKIDNSSVKDGGLSSQGSN